MCLSQITTATSLPRPVAIREVRTTRRPGPCRTVAGRALSTRCRKSRIATAAVACLASGTLGPRGDPHAYTWGTVRCYWLPRPDPARVSCHSARRNTLPDLSRQRIEGCTGRREHVRLQGQRYTQMDLTESSLARRNTEPGAEAAKARHRMAFNGQRGQLTLAK